MLFNSSIFIFVLLPVALIGWYTLNNFKQYKIANVFLALVSLWFYGYYNPIYLVLILGSITVNYTISYLMTRFVKRTKLLLILGLTFNILLLGYFKYYDFFISNVNFIFKSSFNLKHIVLPLGISFFTLQQISFLVDRYWETAPHYPVVTYVCYVTFFPQLIAGPIVLHSEFIPQFENIDNRKFNSDNFADGIVLFVIGLAKKMLIADSLAVIVNFGFEQYVFLEFISTWIVAICYAIQLYFDFSGYCDMAWGLGKMFNFTLPINFNSPYRSYSITEHWSRWHITLTRFFTTYIYNPLMLSGIRKKKKKLYKYICPMVVFTVSGFWHGASWTFVIWGIMQGVATIWNLRKKHKFKKGIFTWLCYFLYTVVADAIFRAESLTVMNHYLKSMFTFKFSNVVTELFTKLGDLAEFYALAKVFESTIPQYAVYTYSFMFIILFGIAVIILRGKNSHEILAAQKEKGFTIPFTIGIAALFVWCIISLNQVSTFLYFNF